MPESESEPANRFRVGYALPERKLGCFMVPTFINHARDRGIDLVPIDVEKPLADQSPFDCVVHKLYTDEWKLNLNDFMAKNPKTVVIDPPSAIERLQNRISMLDFIPDLKIPKLSIPNQVLVSDSSSLLTATGELKFPMIAKPVVVDGSAKSHKMSLVLNQEGLTKGLDLDSPVVLQQFVNHGGVIFKVYVAGDYVKCVKRPSLNDISPEILEKTSEESGGVVCFSQISNTAIAGDDDDGRTEDSGEVKMPAAEFVSETANGLRRELGLHLFNFDMIRDDKGSGGYLVIDINYFPGFEKLPSFEIIMTDFFLNVIMKSRTPEETTADGGSR